MYAIRSYYATSAGHASFKRYFFAQLGAGQQGQLELQPQTTDAGSTRIDRGEAACGVGESGNGERGRHSSRVGLV